MCRVSTVCKRCGKKILAAGDNDRDATAKLTEKFRQHLEQNHSSKANAGSSPARPFQRAQGSE